MTAEALLGLRAARDRGAPRGIVSVCSAHPLVIEAALREALAAGAPALIEATCNQVNHRGGYTGLTPTGFADLVGAIADAVGLPRGRVVLGGDHLGPNPWRALPAPAAMAEAHRMVAAYAEAGFGKLHLDCSMGCAGEAATLPDALVAERAAALAATAEDAAPAPPVYVIGTEVPVPGGVAALDHLAPTRPEAVRETVAVHRAAFPPDAFARVLALVVQPGVEFGHTEVAVYRPGPAAALAGTLDALPGLVFEAHSTDYQPEAALAALVRDGFAILKVGPALTFALREALYGLELAAGALGLAVPSVRAAAEAAMLAAPEHWRSHYGEDAAEQRLLRHYSYSDRIRYYWGVPALRAAAEGLLAAWGERRVPAVLVSQFLPRLHERVVGGELDAQARTLVVEAVGDVLRAYGRACGIGRTDR